MAATIIPTSRDIYLEVDGKKVAVVQSYTAQTTKTSTDGGGLWRRASRWPPFRASTSHVLELTRIYATDEAIRPTGSTFTSLEDFSLVICKPDRRMIYSGCQWSNIGESGTLGAMVVEKVTVVAARADGDERYDHSRLAAAAHGPGRGQAAHGGGLRLPYRPGRRWRPGGRRSGPGGGRGGAGPLCQRLPGGPGGARTAEAALPLGQGGAGGLWAGGDRDPGPAVGGLEPEGGPLRGQTWRRGRLEGLKAQLADLPWQRLQLAGAPASSGPCPPRGGPGP